MTNLSPREIVSELDRFIVGQNDAKKAVAIALRNRWRRQQLEDDLRDEVVPKNILMIGPTGCGKTEIARRLSKLAHAPFIKIEATKFTEVGYVGRDVDSIVRDLLEMAIGMVRDEKHKTVRVRAEQAAEDRILHIMVGDNASEATLKKFREKLRDGKFDDDEIEIDVADNTNPMMQMMDMPGMPGAQMGMMNLGDMLGGVMGDRKKRRTMLIKDAKKLLIAEESDKLIDHDNIVHEAISLTENQGIVFLDEIDKITVRESSRGGEVSREGVQRDLLPLIEGTTVSTKHGPVSTDHILFIASGAFHVSKPSDLLPELQGRLPIRVELSPLTTEDMVRILTEPEASLVTQTIAMMGTEDVTISFRKDAVQKMAEMATKINQEVENIGARRLHTMMEKLMEDISFTAPDRGGETINITAKMVEERLSEAVSDTDLSKFIL